jgi:hypothetical protein
MDSLKVLDPEGPIREADIVGQRGHVRKVPIWSKPTVVSAAETSGQ